jgi:hypothetical protein
MGIDHSSLGGLASLDALLDMDESALSGGGWAGDDGASSGVVEIHQLL